VEGPGKNSVLNSTALAPRHLSSALTPVGRELARLPVDPTVGRMILQARTEKALKEVVIIAAGLSVQDPRERPLDKQQQADTAHRRFAHPDSDFLTLLNIWETYHDEFETMSQGRLRRFCRDHFLSYTRMREWRDIHDQLIDVLKERDDFRMSSARDGLARGTGDSPGKPGERGQARKEQGARAREQEVSSGSSNPLGFGTPGYRAIHRSILAGLLSNIAVLDEETGQYKATHDRKVTLFPGSVLFRREAPRKKDPAAKPADAKSGASKRTPKWILASEIMETSRLYARTCARLDPAWALELGAHVLRVAHSEPYWNAEAGRVMVKQRSRLYGLELESRAVSYGKINPVHATEIFIREGLVNDTITYPLDFITHNRKVRAEVEELLTRARDSGYLNLDEAAYRFYAERLMPQPPPTTRAGTGPADNGAHLGVSSVGELLDLVRERRGAEPRFLMMEPQNLRDPETITVDAEAFPKALPIENRALPLNYAYRPGQADDGVTLDVSIKEADDLTPAALDWAVPGHFEAKVEHYLRALPKSVRVQLAAAMPLGELAKALTTRVVSRDRLTDRRESLTQALAGEIREQFRLTIDPAVWSDKPLPEHLQVRVRVLDEQGRELGASRDLDEIRRLVQQRKHEASVAVARVEPDAWRRARAKWETTPQTAWTFGDIPAAVLVTEQAGVPVHAFPGLQVEKTLPAPDQKRPVVERMPDGVALRLFKTADDAAKATRAGLAALLERHLSNDLGWLERDLRAMRELGALISTLLPLPELQRQAFESIREWLTDPARIGSAGKRPESLAASAPSGATTVVGAESYTGKSFAAALEKAKADLRGIVPRFVDQLREILGLRQALLVTSKPPAWVAAELERLVPPDFLRKTPYPRLAHLPRYLKAVQVRVERARKDPAQDAKRLGQIVPYEAARSRLKGAAAEAFRWLLEELRVSVFAQELGTAEPVSAVKLDRVLAAWGGEPPKEATAAPVAKPIVAAPVTEKKAKPLKHLGALDKLFRP
jgi:ATP-dependent helicase HrpA